MFEIKEHWHKFIIIGVVIGLLVFLHFINALAPIENLIHRGLAYVQAPVYNFANKFFKSEKKREKEELEKQIASLQEQVELYAIQISQLKQKEEDEEEYKAQLQFLEKNEYRSVGAKIVGKSSDGYSQIYLINQGSDAGIQENYPVITANGILMGKILTSQPNSAQVLLATSNLSKIGGQVQNKTKSQGVVSGQHGLTLVMELISKDEKLNKYDLVVTSGLEENIPQGLLIGQIESAESKESELFQSAKISPLIDYRQQNIVSVIIP